MYIQNYQMHNVLNVYTKKLGQNKTSERQKTDYDKSPVEQVSMSAEGKRQMVIDKVASEIVERITRFGPQNETDQEIVDKLQNEMKEQKKSKTESNGEFVYNVIDDDNNKNTSSLSLDNSDFMTNRLEQLAKETVNKNMAS